MGVDVVFLDMVGLVVDVVCFGESLMMCRNCGWRSCYFYYVGMDVVVILEVGMVISVFDFFKIGIGLFSLYIVGFMCVVVLFIIVLC